MQFPYEINDVSKETNQTLLDFFKGEKDGFVQVGPSKFFFPRKFKDNAETYYNFQARSSDIWVSTFPRSGTTWTQEMVWLLGNDLNFDRARTEYLSKRFPFFEFNTFMHPQIKQELLKANEDNDDSQAFIEQISQSVIPFLDGMTEQRFIKSHLPLSLMPPSVFHKNSKIIYVARNPKDVAVSYYHLNRLFKTQGYVGNFEFYWNLFEKGLNPWMPYWDHLKEAWERKDDPNILFVFYEDMKKDIKKSIKIISEFMNKQFSEEQIQKLVDHLSFQAFKDNTSVNRHEMRIVKLLNENEEGFIRKGDVNGNDFELTPKLKFRMNQWFVENVEKTGITFPDYS